MTLKKHVCIFFNPDWEAECETQQRPTFLLQPSPPPTQTSSRLATSQKFAFLQLLLVAALVLKPALSPPPWHQLGQSLAQMSTSRKGETHYDNM